MIRTRIAAAIAAVALICFAVFGGAIAAQAVIINPPTITSTGGDTVDTTPLILGTVDNPNSQDLTVTVYVSNSFGTSNYCFASVPYFSATTGAPWGCSGLSDLPYEEGQSFSAVVAEDITPLEYSLSSNVVQYSIGGTQPAVLSSPTPGATTYDATPTFSGTGPSLGLIDVNDGSFSYCTSIVDAAGTWSCTVSAALPAAIYAGIRADPTLIDGTAAPGTTPQSLEVLVPPAPSVDQLFDPWRTSYDRPDIQGNKDVDSSYIQGYWSTDGDTWTAYCQTSPGVGATVWYCDPAFSSIPLGTVLVAAVAFNEADDASPMGAPITIERVPEPAVTNPVNGSFTNDTTPTISGTATGSNVTLWYGGEGILCSGPIASGSFSCTPSPLTDGTYEYSVEATPGSWVTSGPWSFTVDTVDPASPIISGPSVPAATTSGAHPTISGSGEPGAVIDVYIDGVATGCIGAPVTVDQFGSWSCQVAPAQAPGTYEYAARQTDRAGNGSGLSATQLLLTILSPPPEVTPATLAITPPAKFLLLWFLKTGGATEFQPGDETTLSGDGLPPGAPVDAEFHSTPVHLGSTVVKADGTFSLDVTIPVDAEPGPHDFVVTVTPAGQDPSVVTQPVTIMQPDKAASSPGPKDEALDPAGAAVGSERDDPGAPSSFTHSIDTVQQVISNPLVIATAGAAGLALLLFVAFPAELLNSTISEQYGRFAKRLPKLKATWLTRLTAWLQTTPLFGGIAITIAAAFIFGFADPGFGFDVTSFRVVLSCAIALFIVGYLASSIAGLIIRKRWDLATTMELKPLGLILTVVGVVISRLLEFSPGFLIGLILGIALVGRTTVPQRAKATLVQAGVVFVLSVLGWIGYSILSGFADPTTFVGALAFDTLVAMTTEGLTALFIGLLPFRFLDGSAIFEHSKVLWAVAYAVAAAAFVLIVLPAAWGELNGSLWLWIAIVGAFALVAVAIYLYFRFWAPPLEEDEEPAELVTSGNESA